MWLELGKDKVLMGRSCIQERWLGVCAFTEIERKYEADIVYLPL